MIGNFNDVSEEAKERFKDSPLGKQVKENEINKYVVTLKFNCS